MEKILIVGAGPTGLVVAAELARQGIPLRIIDRAPARSVHSKALGVQARTLETLEIMGGGALSRAAVQAGVPVQRAHLSMREGVWTSIDVSAGIDSPYPFILILAQSETERLLEEHLRTLGVEVERGVELRSLLQSPEGVRCELSSGSLSFEYVIGCDGAHSVVRKQMGSDFAGAPYAGDFVLGDVRVEWPELPGSPAKGDEIYTRASADGVLACFPMKGGGDRQNKQYRLIGALRGSQSAYVSGAQAELGLEEFRAIVARLAPAGTRVLEASWLSRFRLHHRLVERLRDRRVFIAGDAAHIHSPVGGQGMNTGMQDAFNLAWKLGRVLRSGGTDGGDRLLDTYEQERLPVARAIVSGTDRITRIGMLPETRLNRFVRTRIAARALGVASLQRRALRALSELEVNYATSPIVMPDSRAPGPRSGLRAPTCPLRAGTLGPWTLYDALHEKASSHQLLVFHGHGEHVDLSGLRGAFGPEIQTHEIFADTPHGVEAHRIYRVSQAMFYLIRPDGYICARGPLEELELLPPFLATYLQ